MSMLRRKAITGERLANAGAVRSGKAQSDREDRRAPGRAHVSRFHAYNLLAAVASLTIAGLCSASGMTRRDGTTVLPVIDRQDIHFVTLSGPHDELKQWIQGITQDNQGFMWFATSHGLFRYDGYALTPYFHDPNNTNSIASNSLTTLYKDRSGIIWIGTAAGLDNLDPVRGTFTHFRHQSGVDGSLTADGVNCIYQDREGMLWVGTNGGLDRLDPSGRKFMHYKHNPADPASLTYDEIVSVYEDRHHNFWVGTAHGLNKFDRATGRSAHFVHDPADPHSLGHDYVRNITEDGSGNLWLSSVFGDGISALNVQTQEFTRYSVLPERPGDQNMRGVTSIHEGADGTLWMSTMDNGLLSLDAGRQQFSRYLDGQTTRIFEDTEGSMWIGTRTRGVMRFAEKSRAFVNYRQSSGQPSSRTGNEIDSVGTDSEGHLWFGMSKGLEMLDRKTGQIVLYQHKSKEPGSLSDAPVFATAEDRAGRMWFATYGAGLDLFDRSTGRFTAWRHDPKNPDSLSSDLIICMLVDHEGMLWLGTNKGLDRYDVNTGNFKKYLSRDPVTTLLEDHTGALWVGTNTAMLSRFNRKSGQITAYHSNSQDPGAPGNARVEAMYEDRLGTLWFGMPTGLYRLNPSGSFTRFATQDGLPDSFVAAIVEDRHGDLWLATHSGISHFSPRTGRFRNYSEADGLPGNAFGLLGESASRTPDGALVLGSSSGVTVFDPDRLSPNSYLPPVVLTGFLLFNRPVRPDGKSTLQKPIWATNTLTLNHNQNIFTLEFASLSYIDPERNRYRYRLEGLEKDWNEVDSKQRLATYTNLAPARYVFRVQGSNNDLLWNDAGVSLAITVLPPWWGTWWFRTALALGIAGLIATTHQMRLRALRLTAARLEREVADRTVELKAAKDSADAAREAAERANRAKSGFLSLMSHELRTPLNAILGFASLLRRDSASEKQRADLDIITRSGEHLLGLINELLDLARIEAGRETVEIAAFDLRHLIRDVINLMRVRALEKNLELKLIQSPALPRFVATDAAKLRQMLINLLGNAIRHTEQGGVTLRLDAQTRGDAEQMLLSFEVEDTGIGIALEDQERIFEPFVQVGKDQHQKGTGLGLAITRQYAVMLGGTIRVSSAPGEGSLFRLELPAKRTEPVVAEPVETEREYILAANQPEFRILVVDDQAESRVLLQRLLEKAGFQVRMAEDGAQAVETFQSWHPHFIWMDLRMPGVDGAEAARRIRAMRGEQQVTIAAVTASENTHSAIGMDDIVRKPYQAHQIFECMERHMRVIWRDAWKSSERRPAGLRPEALAALPESLRAELTDAVVTLDANQISGVIERISRVDAALGAALGYYADRFSLTTVWEALKASKSIINNPSH